MKKLGLLLAGLIGLSTVAFGATDQTVNGTIQPIAIGEAFSITIDGYSIETVQGDDDIWTAVGSNLDFGTVDTTSKGIFSTLAANEVIPDDVDEYSDIPHRAGKLYNEVRVYVTNNAEPFAVKLKLTDGTNTCVTEMGTPEDVNGVGSTSPVHLTTLPTADANTTSVPTNLNFQAGTAGANEPMLKDVDVVVYESTEAISDLFSAILALDFLPLDITPGTYGGNVVWTLDANP